MMTGFAIYSQRDGRDAHVFEGGFATEQAAIARLYDIAAIRGQSVQRDADGEEFVNATSAQNCAVLYVDVQ